MRALEIAGGIGVLVMMGLTVADALLRTFVNAPILGAHDIIEVLLAAVVAAAIPASIAGGAAISITMAVDRLPAGLRSGVQRLVSAACTVALGYLAWRCFLNGLEAESFGETTMLLRLPHAPFYMVLAAGFALSTVLFAVECARGRRL